MPPPGVDHHKHHEIESRNQLDSERGKIEWNRVADWFEHAPETIVKPLANLLTGKDDGEVDLDNPDHAMLVYYVYALAENNQEQIFTDTYTARFAPRHAKEKWADPVPTPSKIMGEVGTFLTASKPESKDSASRDLRVDLADLLGVEAHYDVAMPALLKGLCGAPAAGLEAALRAADQALLVQELRAFYTAVKKEEKAIESVISHRPIPASAAVFFCIRQEHAALGKTERDLEDAAVEDTTAFAVDMTSKDFGGIKAEGDGLLDTYGADLRKLKAAPSQIGRKSAATVLSQFAAFHGLTPASSDHDIEHHLEKVPTHILTELVGILRHDAVEDRERGVLHGVKEQDLAALGNFVRVIETMVAARMKKDILPDSGDYKDAWKKVPGIVRRDLRVPLHHVHADPKKVRDHLKHYHPPKAEGEKEHGKGVENGLARLGAVGHIIAGVGAALDRTINLVRGRGFTPTAGAKALGGGDKGGAHGGGAHGH